MVFPQGRFQTTYHFHIKMGLIGCAETSVRNYHSTLRKITKERISHLHRGGSLQERNTGLVMIMLICAMVYR